MSALQNHLILVWLFPILFMMHDFEEIIFLRSWFFHYREYMTRRFPKITMRLASHLELSPQAFSLGVAEEFLIISGVTVFSFAFHNYLVWFGLFFAFTLHLLLHLIQCILLRKYIPSVVTAAAVLPYCVYTYAKTFEIAVQPPMIISAVLSTVLMSLNLIFIHHMMKLFDKWLDTYEKAKWRTNDGRKK